MAASDARPHAVIFDVGRVLFDWQPRYLYERLVDDDQALEAFLRDVLTMEWHLQHDAGRDFADTSAELIAQYPEHAELIRAWGPRFNETLPGEVPGVIAILEELDAAGVPLFAITNFSHEFFPPFRATREDVFGRFRDIVVSGEERLLKPDAAIYRLALDRFGLKPEEAVFIDDSPANVAGANALGIHGLLFADAETLRRDLRGLGLLE